MLYYSSKETIPAEAPIGGKARNLYLLKDKGFKIPAWVVIPQQDIPANAEISTEFIQSILNEFEAPGYFAVRSSATDEDGADFSFAGQFETYLYVPITELADKIKTVWQSAFSERVLAYRATNGLAPSKGIAVIIQAMVDAEVAGVGFGINPVNGDRKARLISSVYGLGEGLVSGELDADTFTVKGDAIESQITQKIHQFKLSKNGNGLEKSEVALALQSIPSLKHNQLKEIAAILDKLQQHLGRPQDIEFAISNEQIYLLQSRPVTTLHTLPDINAEFIIWDNSNIIESYPGITSPLTFSFIIKVYEGVYKQLAGLMGVNKEEIEAHANTFANMLGLIEGRVYYNLLSWYKLLALLPGYSINTEFMEKMMGVKERFELKEEKQKSKFNSWLRILGTLFKMIRNLMVLPRQKKLFVEGLNNTIWLYEAINFDECSAHELMAYYFDFEQTLLKKWKAPLVNDFFAMIYFGVMQKLVVKYKIGANPNLHNDLLCGAKDIISAEPIRRILAITALIQENKEAMTLFAIKEETEILEAIKKPGFEEINKAIESYLHRFGERCVGELKLETISYNQNPEAFIKILKSYAANHAASTGANDYNEKLRQQAEQTVKEALKGKVMKKLMFNYFLKGARELVSSRENLRYERTRAFGMVRKIFSAIGRRLYAENLIEHPRDIFYLKKEEIFEFIQGTSVNRNLKSLISLRKTEYHAFGKLNPAERIKTYGIVYQGNNFNASSSAEIMEGDLKGIGCCAGVVKAKVRVILDPSEISHLGGDILVTSSTDPGWVTLFPSASGILVERGSLLSHSAIVSREMGIPCIVGITGLLSRLKSSDWVEMDGSTGNIKILNEQSS